MLTLHFLALYRLSAFFAGAETALQAIPKEGNLRERERTGREGRRMVEEGKGGWEEGREGWGRERMSRGGRRGV